MNILVLLILASLGIALSFLLGFIWAVRTGQFDDTFTPSLRILTEEERGHQGPVSKTDGAGHSQLTTDH